MSSIVYNDHFAVGMGSTAAVQFTNKKESHTTIVPEKKGASTKIALWGDDNRYPQRFMETVRNNGAAGTSYRFNKATHYGQGFQLVKEDTTDDGKRDRKVVPIKSIPEINQFFRRSKMKSHFWPEIITDLETFNLAFPEFILSWDYKKIVSVRRQMTAKMRYEAINEKTGLIEKAYFCHDWQTRTDIESDYVSPIHVVDSYMSAEEVKEYCKSRKIYKFTMPIFYPLVDETYYPEPDHHSVFRNGWMEVVNNIPEYKKHFSQNQLNIKYMVYISEEYFIKTYPNGEWENFSTEQKKEIRKKLTNDIDEHLAGNKNAGKSIQSTVFKDREGKWVKGIEVVPLEDKTNSDGKGLLDASSGNAEIMSAIGLDPNLLGVGIPGGKMNTGSGSDKREAFSILNSLFKTKRETTLEIWRMIRDYNGWDENLEGEFPWTELTTLDNNPTGQQNVM